LPCWRVRELISRTSPSLRGVSGFLPFPFLLNKYSSLRPPPGVFLCAPQSPSPEFPVKNYSFSSSDQRLSTLLNPTPLFSNQVFAIPAALFALRWAFFPISSLATEKLHLINQHIGRSRKHSLAATASILAGGRL